MFLLNDALTTPSPIERQLAGWTDFTASVSLHQRQALADEKLKREKETNQVYQKYSQEEWDKKRQEFFRQHAPAPIQRLSPLIPPPKRWDQQVARWPKYLESLDSRLIEKRHRPLSVNKKSIHIRKETSLDFPSLLYQRKDAHAYSQGQYRASLFVKDNHHVLIPKASFRRHNYTNTFVASGCPPKCTEHIQVREDVQGITDKPPWRPLAALDEIPYTKYAQHTKTVLLDKRLRYQKPITDSQVFQLIDDWDRKKRIKKYD